MEFIRNTVTQSAADTTTEDEFATPVSRSEKLAMLIWRVKWDIGRPQAIDNTLTDVEAHLADRSQTAFRRIETDGIISTIERSMRAGVAQGTLSEYAELNQQGDWVEYFQPPLLYSKDSLFLLVGSSNTGVANFASVMVGYTLEKVPAELFIAALVE